MPNNYFEFKQFRIYQDGAAMKVGTDGVLLGAWMQLDGTEQHILDIGTGTGLLALMMAQRSRATAIDAVEIDEAAVRQAKSNAATSPWTERIHIHHIPIQDFVRQATARYDHIVSNPPFFVRSLKAPDAARSAARHTDTLAFEDLISAANTLMTPRGRFSVIYPTEEAAVFETLAAENGLYCKRRTKVKGTSESAIKRILMEFSQSKTAIRENELVIELARHQYSPEYITLTRDFYLKF